MDEAKTDEHGRPMPPEEARETATLLGFLDYQRATLEWKCRELSDDQLRVALPPTSMTLGGLLKHLASVEDYWFTEVVGGEPTPEPWASADTETETDPGAGTAQLTTPATICGRCGPSESTGPGPWCGHGSARARTRR